MVLTGYIACRADEAVAKLRAGASAPSPLWGTPELKLYLSQAALQSDFWQGQLDKVRSYKLDA